MSKSVSEIKRVLDSNIGRRILVKANGGRRKTTERSGVLTETYKSIFIVQLDYGIDSFERVSYSYTDILTDAVQITFHEESLYTT